MQSRKPTLKRRQAELKEAQFPIDTALVEFIMKYWRSTQFFDRRAHQSGNGDIKINKQGLAVRISTVQAIKCLFYLSSTFHLLFIHATVWANPSDREVWAWNPNTAAAWAGLPTDR